MARKLGMIGLGILWLAVLYVLLLCFPRPLFAYKVTEGNLTLYCDDPIPESAAGTVLKDVQRRLELCSLYKEHPKQDIFVCNRSWRYRLLTHRNARGGGLAYGFCPWNVFLRKSDIAANVLFRKDGSSSGADRTLAYFIAHEITHNLTTRFLGPLVAWHLPAWKREGFADYVGKGGQFDFRANLALFKKNDPTLDPKGSGLYLRYHLLVAELLDRRKVSVEGMLKGDFDRKKIEADLKEQ